MSLGLGPPWPTFLAHLMALGKEARKYNLHVSSVTHQIPHSCSPTWTLCNQTPNPAAMNLHKALAALTGLLHAAATSAQWTKTPIWEAPGTYASTLDDPSCTTVDAGHWDSDVPRMHTALISTFANYSRSIYGDCARTMTASDDGMAYAECMPQHEEYCGFSSLVPDSLHSEYVAYTNSASAWWETHSSRIFEVVEECPYAWIMAMALSDTGPSWFRLQRCTANARRRGRLQRRRLRHQHQQRSQGRTLVQRQRRSRHRTVVLQE
jgi:hypothetical protein